MDTHQNPTILLTNDDGIESPGLWAAAAALAHLGEVIVAAPNGQSSGAGRSLPASSDGTITPRQVALNGTTWTAYGIGGSPAQAVLHGLLEIAVRRPALVVSGINYGENVGSGITSSGTVGAALEAAGQGIPALAVSLETDPEHHRSYATTVDFATAAHFAVLFARMLLEHRLPLGVDVLKVDVPATATPETGWALTRLSRQNYYDPIRPERTAWEQSRPVGYQRSADPRTDPPDTDIYTLRVKKWVSVTPITLDMTARVDFRMLEQLLSA